MSKKSPQLRFEGFTDDWEERKLGDTLTELKSGLSRMLSNNDIGLPVVRANNINDGQFNIDSDVKYWYVNDPQGANTVNYLIRKNDILINFINSEAKMGTATIVENTPIRDTIYTTNILRARIKKEYDSYYWFALTQINQYKINIKIITKPAVNQASFTTVDFKKLNFMFPNLKEQQKIGAFFKQLDYTIALHQRKLDLLKEQKKGYLQKMFPKNGAKVPELRFAGFADDWEERKLGDISKVIDPHPSHRAPAATEEGIPFIGIGDVNEVGNINYKTARIVDAKIFDEHHNRYDLSIPSIGIGRVASLGKVIRLRDDIGKYVVSPTMSVIQFTNNNDLDFLYSNMNTPIFQKQFKSFSNGSTRQSVGIQDLRILMVSLPVDIEEQQKIGLFFNRLDNTITLHQRKLDLLKEQKKGFLQKMFV